MIQANSWAEAVFQTTVRSSATFKEELSAPRDILITAGGSCLAGEWLFVCTSAEATLNCVAQIGALNTAEPL